MKRSVTHGFSLVELLVVIAIIALLMALLVPHMGTLKSAAKRSTCAANQQTLVTSVMNYAADRDGYLVHYDQIQQNWKDQWSGLGWFKWPANAFHSQMLSYWNVNSEAYHCGTAAVFREGYLEDNRVWYCPEDPIRKPVVEGERYYSTGGFFRGWETGKVWSSYYQNVMGMFRLSQSDAKRLRPGREVAYPNRFKGPSNTVMIMDQMTTGDRGSIGGVRAFHKGAWNLAFLDGSVRTVWSREVDKRLQLLQNGRTSDDPDHKTDWVEFEDYLHELITGDPS